jgi:spermidine synthase
MTPRGRKPARLFSCPALRAAHRPATIEGICNQEATAMTCNGIFLRALAALLVLAAQALPQDKVLYEKDSAFNHVLVTEDAEGVRSLLFEKSGALQSVGKPSDPDYLSLPYLRTAFVGLAFAEKPARVLVVGLGGGSIPRFLHKHYPAWQIDAVELDPDVIAVAKQFFGFTEDKTLKAHAGDGRKFIENVKQPYDIIFLDAFGADSIPYSLATKEFLLAVRKALTPNGLVIGNIWSRYSNPLYDSMLHTYQETFDEFYLFTVRASGNRILVALPRKLPLTKDEVVARAAALGTRDKFPYELGENASYGYSRLTEDPLDAKILLDADAPKDDAPRDERK